MSGSEVEENYSKHRERKHRRRDGSPEYSRRHTSHKRRDDDRHEDYKRKRIKKENEEEMRDFVRVKSEPRDRHERRSVKTEPRDEDRHRGSRSRTEHSGRKRNRHENEESNNGSHEWGQKTEKEKPTKPKEESQKPNFSLSGKLAEDTNIFNGVVIKYSEPPEARMPKKRWRLYPFKGDQGLPTLYIHRQSAYLLGRDRKIADIPIDHPSCSKQHAALQYRLVTYQRSDGSTGKQIRLYLIDLESANGTYINNNKIEPKKYVELFEKDVIKFGFSSREYVLLHEHSKDDNESEHEGE